MTFPNRDRPVFGRIGKPVTAATGLPVAAPAPGGVTDDLSASQRLSRVVAHGTRIAPDRCNCCDGTPADRQWATAELKRLEQLADLTEWHGPWEAAKRMYAAPAPAARTASTNVKYHVTLRGMGWRWL